MTNGKKEHSQRTTSGENQQDDPEEKELQTKVTKQLWEPNTVTTKHFIVQNLQLN